VVAHNVSVMVIQAQAASRSLDRDPKAARAALSAIEATGRRTVDEMRWTLGVLRADADEPALAPLPGLAALPDLISSVRSAGLDVHLQVRGAATRLPAGVELSAYRIVQEGLTNALKHGRPSTATVTISYDTTDLHIEVRNTSSSVDDEPGNGGHGLIGLRERVALIGGQLEVGVREAGQWVLRAHLPLATP
jgi:signal transduction histidine kinase